MRVGVFSSLFALLVFFGLGWAGSNWIRARSLVEMPANEGSDLISVGAAHAENPHREGKRLPNVSPGDSRFDIGSEKNRENLEATIRGVPFSFLKQIYLERQDSEWKKADQRYSRLPLEDEQAQKKQTEELFNLFQKNSNGGSFFIAQSEWTFRGGKRVPVILLARLYSSRTVDKIPNGSTPYENTTPGDAALATQGSELCYSASVYFKVGGENESGRYASEGTGSCLRWPTVREGKPYVLFENYAKQLTPLFDKVSAPLPGFGSDAEADPEWYDSGHGAWTALPRVHWDPVTREDYIRNETDLQADTTHN